ncbi:HTH_XRE domain containing protein [uncultured Caudovirales phage]|uniref:HTH_XRE domain containing protein n=1 Tax=uncultured Caudovirales phage TaxID=2100421 RepID=A0A6J5SSE3_9CAUD|nr:HTH_XRE domain containing protein [uncultured Caudovirales phage]
MANRQRPNFEMINKAIAIAGNLTELARRVNVSYQTALDWKHGRRVPTPTNCQKIEKATNGEVKAEEILPCYPWEEIR